MRPERDARRIEREGPADAVPPMPDPSGLDFTLRALLAVLALLRTELLPAACSRPVFAIEGASSSAPLSASASASIASLMSMRGIGAMSPGVERSGAASGFTRRELERE